MVKRGRDVRDDRRCLVVATFGDQFGQRPAGDGAFDEHGAFVLGQHGNRAAAGEMFQRTRRVPLVARRVHDLEHGREAVA